MSADHEGILYDLRGPDQPQWIPRQGEEIPTDRILTYELEVYQGSPFGKERRHWKPIWARPDLTMSEISELEKKYPLPVRSESSIDWSRLMG
jgi:hypothetical protein